MPRSLAINSTTTDSSGSGDPQSQGDWVETALPPRDLLEPPVSEVGSPDDSVLRLLPADLTDRESRAKRTIFLALAILISAGYFYFLASFLAPAHPGVDQNGYLVGGKQLALTGSTGMKPTHPLQYVGAMWVMPTSRPSSATEVWYYPKYPIGLPLLDAIPLWINWQHGKDWAYFVSPLSSAFSILAMFLTVRAIAGSYMGILGMLLLGVNSTMLALANNPNSHAPALAFVTWGMFLLLRFWQTASVWRGLLAGFLLGFAVTIRYSEGLLLAPMMLTIVCMIRYRRLFRLKIGRMIVGLLPIKSPLFGWAIPVLWLVGFNWFAMHSITGYDTTKESSGFKAELLPAKWETTVQQLYDYGVFLFFPMAMMGLALVWRSSVRLGLFICLWFLPGAILYTAYYWSGGGIGIWFLRFFLTVIPALILAAMWFIRHAGWYAPQFETEQTRRGAIAMPIAAGLLTAISTGLVLRSAVPLMERESAANWNLAFAGKQITTAAPPGSVLIASDQNGLLNYIQWKGDYELYPIDAFNTRGLFGLFLKIADNGAAQPLQLARYNFLQDVVYKDKTTADMTRELHKVAAAAINDPKGARRVFAMVDNVLAFQNRFIKGSEYEDRTVAAWKDPATVLLDPAPSALMPPRGFSVNRSQQRWTILELKKKPAPTTTATAPATTQAAE